jgi:hypothetical protein
VTFVAASLFNNAAKVDGLIFCIVRVSIQWSAADTKLSPPVEVNVSVCWLLLDVST